MIDETNVFNIPDRAFVTLTKMNNIIEVQYLKKKNIKNNIKKISDDEYLILSTGQIKQYEHSSNRFDCKNSLRQTFKKLRYYINNNFAGNPNELFITLTYKENMQDVKKLYDDVRKFLMRLKYYFKDTSKIEYINVVEPQSRGAWHCHVLIKFIDLNSVYVPNKTIADLWGYGFVNVRSISKMSVDNIGAYLTAYLADLPVSDFDNFSDQNLKEVEGKKFIKGGRLNLYPKGMNLYRKSKGIKFPKKINIPFRDIKKYVGSCPVPTYFSKKDFSIDDFDNTVIFYSYNLSKHQ